MAALLISYDLNKPGKDYATLIARIKALSTNNTWWHYLDSLFVIKTTWSATQARDDLTGYIDNTDELVVVDVTGDGWAGVGFPSEAYEYLRTTLK